MQVASRSRKRPGSMVLLVPPEGANPANTLISAQQDPGQTSELQNSQVTRVCPFKPHNV